MDTVLTDIGKTSRLTASQLKELGNSSFETASKYGKSASDYLAEIQKMYRAGYKNAQEMAELSVRAQAADSEIAVSEMSAAMGTMMSVTRQSGKETAKAWNEILAAFQQTSAALDSGMDENL